MNATATSIIKYLSLISYHHMFKYDIENTRIYSHQHIYIEISDLSGLETKQN